MKRLLSILALGAILLLGLHLKSKVNIQLTFNIYSARSSQPKNVGPRSKGDGLPESWNSNDGYAGDVKGAAPLLAPTFKIPLVYLLILVSSPVGSFQNRDAIRRICASVNEVRGKTVRAIFVTGRSVNAIAEERIRSESYKFDDILQFDLSDSFGNLTLKTVLGLTWAVNDFNRMQFVMKVDDDIIFNAEQAVIYLLSLEPIQAYRLYAGYVVRGATPIRSSSDKYYVPAEVFADDLYPDYAAGPSYVLSTFAAKLVVEQAKYLPFLTMEDVYVGMCAKASGLSVIHSPGFAVSITNAYNYCQLKSKIAIRGADGDYRQKFWDDFLSERLRSKASAC